MKYVTAVVLYAVFSVVAMFAGLVGLLALPFKPQYTANVSHSMDMLLAALMGWDGRSTVSKECGRSPCKLCRFLCAVLDRILEKDHCAKEARE